MTDTTADEEVEEAKPSKLPLIIGVVLALAGGGGGFFAVQSGMLGGGGGETAEAVEEQPIEVEPLPDVAFLEVPPLTVSFGAQTAAQFLRFRASLEIPSNYLGEVERILPRVQDVMNSYLRALDVAELEAPGALIRLRAQMLRRVQLVAGEGRVRDLLVLEFVLN